MEVHDGLRSEGQPEEISGYKCYWRRMARHLNLSDGAKAVGVRSSQLSAFERGLPEELTAEQKQAYYDWLFAFDPILDGGAVE